MRNLAGSLVLAALAAAIWLIPSLETIAQEVIQSQLAKAGFPEATLTVDVVTFDRIILRDITLGEDVPLSIDTMTVSFPYEQLKTSQVTITEASARWNGGTLSTENAQAFWAGGKRLEANLQVRRVPLQALLSGLTAGRASASGLVSGDIPLAVDDKGHITFGAGQFKTTEPGTIKVAEGAIPGDNEQVTVVREVLANFHYNVFSMQVSGGEHDKLSILLSLSGHNPDAYNGREVKLNVRLTGDVINLIQQSLLPSADPRRFLEP